MINDIDLARSIKRCYKNPDVCSHGVEARIEHVNDYQIIAIRGTTDMLDWISNLRAWIIPAPFIGLVHAGFYLGARRALEDIIYNIDLDKPIYIAGHSKGGPEAIIIARLLQVNGYKINKVVTFGAPQFITGWGIRSLKSLLIRQYRNGGDLVPLLPSRRIKLLLHARHLVQIGNGGAPVGTDDYHAIEHYIDVLSDG